MEADGVWGEGEKEWEGWRTGKNKRWFDERLWAGGMCGRDKTRGDSEILPSYRGMKGAALTSVSHLVTWFPDSPGDEAFHTLLPPPGEIREKARWQTQRQGDEQDGEGLRRRRRKLDRKFPRACNKPSEGTARVFTRWWHFSLQWKLGNWVQSMISDINNCPTYSVCSPWWLVTN